MSTLPVLEVPFLMVYIRPAQAVASGNVTMIGVDALLHTTILLVVASRVAFAVVSVVIATPNDPFTSRSDLGVLVLIPTPVCAVAVANGSATKQNTIAKKVCLGLWIVVFMFRFLGGI